MPSRCRRVLCLAVALVAIAPHAEAGPLSLRQFFDGPLTATGVVENLRDGTRRALTIAMRGSWAGPTGTLVEDIAYADGERQHKVWRFEPIGEGRYAGYRSDVTGEAAIVEDDAGISMTYKADTKVPAGLTLNLDFVDRFTRVDATTVAVRSDVTYLFLSAARLTLTITRDASRPPAAKAPK